MGAEFEKSFADYLDGTEYDEAENALFTAVRNAYRAGWKAAGGEPPQPQKVLHIVRNPKEKENKILDEK